MRGRRAAQLVSEKHLMWYDPDNEHSGRVSCVNCSCVGKLEDGITNSRDMSLSKPLERVKPGAAVHGVAESDTTERLDDNVDVGQSPLVRVVMRGMSPRPPHVHSLMALGTVGNGTLALDSYAHSHVLPFP